MNPSTGRQLDPRVLEVLRDKLSGSTGAMSLESFIECALYHPEQGYYCRQRQRVGHQPSSDFYTASSLGHVFSRLVLASLESLLEDDLAGYTFVEAGPESTGGVLGNIEHSPFKDHLLIRPGDAWDLPPKAIVFSNELFDAQPFRRFVWTSDAWREMGVAIEAGQLQWVQMKPEEPLPPLPETHREGYTIDWPGKALALLETISQASWQGLFVAFDYGLDRSVAFSSRPEGTGRTYAGHKMGDDLLDNPGHTDITCHVIWDDLEEILRQHRFREVRVQRQEAFLMLNGQAVVADILQAGEPGLQKDKQTLMELVHPDNMGHKFQVLSAQRSEF
jgi:SAM-dependent MidA family methyltransferase